jgi:Zn-dependent protease
MKTKLMQLAAAVITFAIYAKFIGWQGSLLVMIAIGFHEYGHLWGAKKVGYNTGGFYFIPFVGGASLIYGPYRTYYGQAVVVMMGPFFGAILAFVSLLVYYLTGVQFFLQSAYWMTVLNLFNLLPLSALDGGQLWRTVLFSFNKTVGTAFVVLSTIIASIVIWKYNPIIAGLVIILGGTESVRTFKNWLNERQGKRWLCPDSWLNLPGALDRRDMRNVVLAYSLTCVFLIVLMVLVISVPNSNYLSIFIKK